MITVPFWPHSVIPTGRNRLETGEGGDLPEVASRFHVPPSSPLPPQAKSNFLSVEIKLKAVKKWTNLLERESEKQLGPVSIFSSTLESSTPRAVAKLDLLMEKLEDYMRSASPDAPTATVESKRAEGSTLPE